VSWQPIETAPRDGTRILLFIPGFIGDKIWTGLWANAWFTSIGKCDPDEQPSHWMPLPEPPSSLPPQVTE
jgi:disulfide bond formation protein DsbB